MKPFDFPDLRGMYYCLNARTWSFWRSISDCKLILYILNTQCGFITRPVGIHVKAIVPVLV